MASWPSAERMRLDGVGETAPYWTLTVPARAISARRVGETNDQTLCGAVRVEARRQ